MKTLRLLAFFALAALAAAPARAQQDEDAKRFTPYLDMSMGENLFIEQDGNFFSGGTMNGNAGLLANLTANGSNALFGMYSLDYAGPGVQPQDTYEWQFQSINHIFNLEYRWKLPWDALSNFRLRPGISYTESYTRTGANEVWGEGLYDSTSKGYSLAVDYMIPGGKVSATYNYRQLVFPNYTDLLSEFEATSSSNAAAVASGGFENQNITTYGLSLNWKKLFAGVSSSRQAYVNQEVVGGNGVYNPGSHQQDNSFTANAGFTGKLWRFEIQPNASYTKYDSNQNFLRYKYFGATPTGGNFNDPSGDVTYVGDYYSYTGYTVALPFYFNLTRAGTALNFGYSLTERMYTDRPAEDANQNFQSGKETDFLHVITVGLRVRLNDISFLHLSYNSYVGSSNNKFEQYMPYNYTAQAVGMMFEIVY